MDDDNESGLGRYDIFQMVKILKAIKHEAGPNNLEACLEIVGARMKQGYHNAFLQGEGLGLWKALMVALGIPLIVTSPQTWRRAYFNSEGLEYDERKQQSIEHARELFPKAANMLTRKKDDGRAEALLLAEFCRRNYEIRKRNNLA